MNWYHDLPIRRKLFAAFLGTNVVALLVACVAFIATERITFRQGLVRNLTVLADALGQNSTAALSFANKEDAEEILQALRIEPSVVAGCLYSETGEVFAVYPPGTAARDLPELPHTDDQVRFEGGHVELFRPIMLDDKRVGTICLKAGLEQLDQRIRAFIGISILVILGSLLLALALSARLQRTISGPILNLAETTKRIAESKDYTLRATKQTEDEIGHLTDSFNHMLTDIAERTGALQQANESLRQQTTQIQETVDVLGTSADQILSAATQLAANSTETATAVTETTTTVEEVRQTAQVTSQKTLLVSETAHVTAQTSETGRKSAEEAIAGMNRIRQQMDLIAESMMRLSEQTQAVGQIISSVDDLAQQSNLLAVNAAIEAAKAGEQGKGFSVVATEVRSLAEQSKQATTQVRAILSDIQKATNAAVMATEQGGKAVEAGVRQSSEAGQAIQELANRIGETAQAATQIAASSQQQLVGMDQVSNAMVSVGTASTENVGSARQLETAARHLKDLGRKLERLVERQKA